MSKAYDVAGMGNAIVDVLAPADDAFLLKHNIAKAQQASGAGITETIRTGLRLVAASQTYSRLRQLRGKVRFSRTSAQLKDDR